MAIPRYSILKGKVIDSNIIHKNGNDHFIINVRVSEHKYKAYMNILSQDGSDLEFVQNSNWIDPFRSKLGSFEMGSRNSRSS